MFGKKNNRRSFVVDLMSSAAGVWVAVSGGAGLTALATGCSDDDVNTPKYGGVPPKDGSPDTANVPKYGGHGDMRYDTGSPDQAVVKYGGIDAGAKKDTGPVVKYGGFDMGGKKDSGPVVKYGGKMDKGTSGSDGPMMKYGGKQDSGGATPKYGGNPKKYGGQPA